MQVSRGNYLVLGLAIAIWTGNIYDGPGSLIRFYFDIGSQELQPKPING